MTYFGEINLWLVVIGFIISAIMGWIARGMVERWKQAHLFIDQDGESMGRVTRDELSAKDRKDIDRIFNKYINKH